MKDVEYFFGPYSAIEYIEKVVRPVQDQYARGIV